MTKYLVINILQNISVFTCYEIPQSTHTFVLLAFWVAQCCLMSNIYGQKCLSCILFSNWDQWDLWSMPQQIGLISVEEKQIWIFEGPTCAFQIAFFHFCNPNVFCWFFLLRSARQHPIHWYNRLIFVLHCFDGNKCTVHWIEIKCILLCITLCSERCRLQLCW